MEYSVWNYLLLVFGMKISSLIIYPVYRSTIREAEVSTKLGAIKDPPPLFSICKNDEQSSPLTSPKQL